MTDSSVSANSIDAQTAAVKIPPNSFDAEQSVLGSLLLDNTAWDLVVDRVSENDFYRADHRIIFRAITELSRREQPFDVLTVSESLKNINKIENIGGEVYLFELAKNTPTVTNVVAYCDIVRERSILRQLIGVSNEIAGSAFNPGDRLSREILDEAESKIFNIAQQQTRGEGPVDISTLLAVATEKIDTLYHSGGKITGLSTGFSDLDDMTSGLQDGDLIIVAGRPSMGKTAFAINIAEHAAIKDAKPVLVFSMEMPGESLAMRIMSSLGHIDQHKVRTGKLNEDDWPRLTSAVSMMSEASLFIDDTPALSPSEIRARARRLARKHGQIGLIIVDYMQLMQIHGYRENRTMEITEISRSLKALAKELRTPVLALSQLNRSLESRADKRPIMSDLRDSGSIEQDADIIAFIYRDEVYNEDSPDKGKAEIIIAKQRNGPIGKINLTFLGKYTRFENYTSSVYSSESFK